MKDLFRMSDETGRHAIGKVGEKFYFLSATYTDNMGMPIEKIDDFPRREEITIDEIKKYFKGRGYRDEKKVDDFLKGL